MGASVAWLGHGSFVVDGKTIDAGPGDFVTVPKKTWHEFEAITELRFLNWYTPGGFDKLIIGAGVPATARTLPRPICQTRIQKLSSV